MRSLKKILKINSKTLAQLNKSVYICSNKIKEIMTAIFHNHETKETHKISGVAHIGQAWSLANRVCERMNWNEDMFAEDCTITMKK